MLRFARNDRIQTRHCEPPLQEAGIGEQGAGIREWGAAQSIRPINDKKARYQTTSPIV